MAVLLKKFYKIGVFIISFRLKKHTALLGHSTKKGDWQFTLESVQWKIARQKGMMGMEKKIVFFDIDGTLYNREKKIPKSTIHAIERLKEKNIYVAIATGRAPFMYADLRKRLGIDNYISFNGSHVVLKGKVIHKQPLPLEKLKQLERLATKLHHPMIYLDEHEHYTNEKHHPHIRESIINDLKLHYPIYEPNFYLHNDVYQALVYCEPHEEHIYHKQLNCFHFVRWHRYSVDVLPYGGSKANGIKKILETLNIDRQNSYAFGDGLNDVEMLEYVGTGIAMGNGHEKAKASANFVTKAVDEDGIEYALCRFGLI